MGSPQSLGTLGPLCQRRGLVMAVSSSGCLFHIALVYSPPQHPQHGIRWAKPVWWACHPVHFGIGKDGCRSVCSPWSGCRELGSTWLSLEGPLEVSAASPCAEAEQRPAPWHTKMEHQCRGVQCRAALGTPAAPCHTHTHWNTLQNKIPGDGAASNASPSIGQLPC